MTSRFDCNHIYGMHKSTVFFIHQIFSIQPLSSIFRCSWKNFHRRIS